MPLSKFETSKWFNGLAYLPVLLLDKSLFTICNWTRLINLSDKDPSTPGKDNNTNKYYWIMFSQLLLYNNCQVNFACKAPVGLQWWKLLLGSPAQKIVLTSVNVKFENEYCFYLSYLKALLAVTSNVCLSGLKYFTVYNVLQDKTKKKYFKKNSCHLSLSSTKWDSNKTKMVRSDLIASRSKVMYANVILLTWIGFQCKEYNTIVKIIVQHCKNCTTDSWFHPL